MACRRPMAVLRIALPRCAALRRGLGVQMCRPPDLRGSRKSRLRGQGGTVHFGADRRCRSRDDADAARFTPTQARRSSTQHGCPAKKSARPAGSAALRRRAGGESWGVVAAYTSGTLRSAPARPLGRNALRIADCRGSACACSVHGRPACGFRARPSSTPSRGQAGVRIPVIANGTSRRLRSRRC